MIHPTVFELDVFIRRGETSEEFERHVSGCEACALRLSSLARRAHPAELVNDEPQGRRLQAAAVALAACLAVLLMRTVSVQAVPYEFRTPEGVHGVSTGEVAMVTSVDAGPTDSGVR